MHKNYTPSLSYKLNEIINKVNLKSPFLQSNFYPSFNKLADNQMIMKQNNTQITNDDLLVYCFNKQSHLGYKTLNMVTHSKTILEHVFQNTFISTPKFKLSNNKIIITLFYYNLTEKEVSNLKLKRLNHTNNIKRTSITTSDNNQLHSETLI